MNIAAGQKVSIIDHDYGPDSRTDCTVTGVYGDRVEITPRTPWKSQGRRFATTFLTPSSLVWSGSVGHLYHTPPAHTGKPRRLIKSYRFEVKS
jgi:hypothetical protein